MEDQSAAQQIVAIIKKYADWRGEMMSRLRAVIKQADPAIVEEVKWKKPSRPEGVPVWSHEGILCVCDTLKSAVRLTFPRGTQMQDPHRLFEFRAHPFHMLPSGCWLFHRDGPADPFIARQRRQLLPYR